jgi:Predicted membrane protein/domain
MECPHCHRQLSARAKNCASCGGHIPSGQYLLEEAGLDEPTTSPAASTAVSARSGEAARVANLGDRFAAFVLDTVVLFGVFAAVDAWIFMRWGRVEGTELDLTTAAVLLAGGFNALILFCYGWLLEAGFGATLGKALVGIRVVRSKRRGALAASAIRNLLRIVDGFGFYIVGAMVASCSETRQRLGDLCAGTAVVEEEFGRTRKVLALAVWLAVLGGSAWGVPRICMEDHPREQGRYLNRVVVQVGKSETSAYLRIGGMRVDVRLAPDVASK